MTAINPTRETHAFRIWQTLNAEREAERVLEDVLHRRNWTAATRDALADRLEQIVLKAFNDAGMKVVNENRK